MSQAKPNSRMDMYCSLKEISNSNSSSCLNKKKKNDAAATFCIVKVNRCLV